MGTFNLRNDEFRKAVHGILRRAERQIYEERLTQSFVPSGVIDDLMSSENQLVYGRRGVGKTHTLKYFLSRQVTQGTLCHYVDCTSLGSGLGSAGSPLGIAVQFFGAILRAVADSLLEDAVRLEKPFQQQVDKTMESLLRLTELSEPSAEPGRHFDYVAIVRELKTALTHLSAPRLVLILDEWAQVPLTAQPYLGELLKPSLFQIPEVTLKISVVDYMHQLSLIDVNGQTIGLEKSADVFSDVRMDRFFVWDEDRDFVERFFAGVLYNHLGLSLALDFSAGSEVKYDLVVNELFTGQKTFSELCRASEGNARDFLVIFGRSVAEFARQTTRQRIGTPDVQEAASHWFRQDKSAAIATEGHLENLLAELLNSIIRSKRSRTFMVPLRDVEHPALLRLFAARILHPLRSVWSHPDKPGDRYQLITIDYGAYVTLIGTKAEPKDPVFWFFDTPGRDSVSDLVPLDDRRSIRRIIVEKAWLDRFVRH